MRSRWTVAAATLVALALLGSTAAEPSVTATIDLGSATTPFPHFWKRCVGSGHMLLGTRADWRAHLAQCQAELGFEGIRGHGLLDDDMSVLPRRGQPTNLYNVFQVLDFVHSLGMRPVVELSFMPKSLVSCGCPPSPACEYAFSDHGGYKGLVMPPDNFDDWYQLVKEVVTEMLARYGLDTLRQWPFEVWNELWGMPYPSDYLPLYNASAAAIKAVHPALQVGGPATMQVQHIADMVADAKRLNLPLDFVSSHLYPSDPQAQQANTSNDRDFFVHAVLHARAQAGGKPFYLTEYNDGLTDGDHRDTSYAAAYIFRIIPQLTDMDLLSWWTFSDVFEEQSMEAEPFLNQFGLLTKDGVAKPVYRAFQLLANAGNDRLPVALEADGVVVKKSNASAVTVLATTGSGRLQLFIANFATIMHGNFSVEGASLKIKLTGGSLPSSGTMIILDKTHSNPRQMWEGWGSPRYLTPTQIAQLKAESELKSEPVAISSSGEISLSLSPQSVVHIDIATQ